MKFRTRAEQRKVTETVNAVVRPLMYYFDDNTREYFEIALRILNDTGIESEREEQNEIKVGDEVYLIDKNHPRVVTCITKIDGENPAAVQFTESGKWAVDDVTELHKTGRHFDQIEEILKALGED